MRVLLITTPDRTGRWLADALAADSATEVMLEEAVGAVDGLARLRDEVFDALLVCHELGRLDGLELVDGYRGGGADEPILILGSQSEAEMAPLCYEVGADGYLCVNTATTRHLLWLCARAVRRHQLERDNRRLAQAERTRLRREQDEFGHLLDEQRALLGDIEHLAADGHWCQDDWRNPAGAAPPSPHLPEPLIRHYHELLRTYIIMGSGNLGGELRRLAELFIDAQITPARAMQLHLAVIEQMVRGLGTRSTRHVMNRAELLILEVMMHLAEGYRRRYVDVVHPPRQMTLPGFE